MDSAIPAIAHVIQLSVAPVFLLSGIAGLLAVLTNRLGRVIDRARFLEGKIPAPVAHEEARIHTELLALSSRVRLINISITFCTSAALLICAVIAILFVGTYWKLDISQLVVWLFVGAMVVLIGALVIFLREIFIGTRSVRLGMK